MIEKKIALIGSGNAFFKDEGIGLYAAKYLKENYIFTPYIEIVDGGTLGFKLMPLLLDFDEVIIINTASDDTKEAGEITIKSGDEFLEGDKIKKTANEVEIAEMLQICSMSGDVAQTTIISIVPQDIISVDVSLTPTIREYWQEYIDRLLDQISSLGVKIRSKESYIDLDEILDIFANPSIEYGRGF